MIRLLLATASLAMMSCSPRPDAGKQTPQLHQVAYKAEDITTREGATRPFRTTSWRDGLRSRREAAYETATFVSIMDLEHGLQHKWEAADPSGTLETEPLRRRARRGKTFWWEGARTATPAGECVVNGERGSLWARPAFDHVPARTACISADGILLRIDHGEGSWTEITRLTRGPVDPAVFKPPTNATRPNQPPATK